MQQEKINEIKGAYLQKPPVFADERGSFSFRPNDDQFIQENISVSHKNVFRGVHLQIGANMQVKNVRVLQGRALDMIIDLRKESPTFRNVYFQELDGESKVAMYVPSGCGHAFFSLEDNTIFQYFVDKPYDPDNDITIKYDSISAFAEKVEHPILSEKDQAGITLDEFLNRHSI